MFEVIDESVETEHDIITVVEFPNGDKLSFRATDAEED